MEALGRPCLCAQSRCRRACPRFLQVTELVRSEKQVLDLQKEVESLTKEKDKGEAQARGARARHYAANILPSTSAPLSWYPALCPAVCKGTRVRATRTDCVRG